MSITIFKFNPDSEIVLISLDKKFTETFRKEQETYNSIRTMKSMHARTIAETSRPKSVGSKVNIIRENFSLLIWIYTNR